MKILGYELKQTCGACPEQYDVYWEGKQVGYLRLRWGEFSAEVPDCWGKMVYLARPEGHGEFEDHERVKYLTEAIMAIHDWRTD